MDKKFIFINVIIILLLTAAYILEYYFTQYPMKFNAVYSIKECRLEYLAVILAGTALVSYLISSLPFRGLNFKSKFLRIFPLINGIILLFFIGLSTNQLTEKRKELARMKNSYFRLAEKDIQNNKIMLTDAGGLSLPFQSQEILNSIDNIRKKYGIVYQNTGCIIDPMDMEARKKYTETVTPYLTKRNGKDWKKRMQKEIDELITNSRK
ncbi:hypothetical protein [Chryseobacterium sp.]|uniref:FEKKY domain-containing protein n=1 Tax=Chryseobacterium sp. TaxID=1871047 RepID=UPI0025C1759A|nr:hypothetical protein [Chryseobacterium sp.]MBV8326135.1 hypothetical protein [Chryseobacterium sp.]